MIGSSSNARAPGLAVDAAERQIRHTREELSLIADALVRQLTARHLVEKGFDMFQESLSANDTLHRGLDMIRANPVPVALIGIGAAWLLASNTGVVDRIAQDERVEAVRRRAADLGARAGEMATGIVDGLGAASSDMASSVGAAAERAPGLTGNALIDRNDQSGNGWVHQMTDMAQGALRSARDSGGELLHRAGAYAEDGVGRVATQVEDAFTRHPLVIGAIGVMAGALVAALLPATRFENELIGDTSDELWQRADHAGAQAVARIGDAAAEAAARAADTVGEAAMGVARDAADKPSQR